MLLIRELLLGPRRYSDLLAALPGLTTNLLADRLKRLTSEGLIAKTKLPAPAGSWVYGLTDRGLELEPVVLALGRFGASYLTDPPADTVNLRWACLSMKRRWQGSGRGTLVLRAPTRSFSVVLGETLQVQDGELPADAVITGEEGHLLGVVVGKVSPEVTGDIRVWEALREGLFQRQIR